MIRCGSLNGGDGTASGFGRKLRGLKTTADELPDYVERVLRRFDAAREPGASELSQPGGSNRIVLGVTNLTATVGRLDVATGATSGALPTPGAYQQLDGPAEAVVEASGVKGTHANLFLVRISS